MEDNPISWRNPGWREWTLVISALLVVVFVASMISPAVRAIVTDQSTAAWIQALGSIAAIMAAIFISKSQHDREVRAGAADRVEKLKGFQRVLTYGPEMIADALTGFESVKWLNERAADASIRIRPLTASLDSIKAVPLHELPFSYLTEPVLDIRICMEATLGHLQRVIDAYGEYADESRPVSSDYVDAVTGKADQALRAAHLLSEWALASVYAGVESYDGFKVGCLLSPEQRVQKKPNVPSWA